MLDKYLNKIILVDCEDGIKELPDKSIDLVITDPPYQFAGERKSGCFFREGSADCRDYAKNLVNLDCGSFNPAPFLDSLKRIMKRFYGYFFCNKDLVYEYIDYAVKKGYSYDILVMAKTNPIPIKHNHHLPDLEYIILMREGGTYFNIENKLYKDFKKFYLTNCKRRAHPAQKDVELIERFVRLSSKKNDIILDPFVGSGSTCVAAKQNGRQFIGMDIAEEYIKYSNDRLSKIREQRLQNTFV